MVVEKKRPIPIGIPGAPWPTMDLSEETTGSQTTSKYELGILEDADNPMVLYSDRSYAEVMGMLYRGMPADTMLPAFEAVISRLHPEGANRVCNIVSNPGPGKSHLMTLAANAADSRGPIITDAGGKNLEYLLFQTVFDTEESRPLTQSIDDALANGKLDDVSINSLRKFGSHFSEQNGRKCVDWRGLSEDPAIEASTIRETLQLIRTVQRWDASKTGVGFKTVKGPLVLADEQNRILIIDELNKCKEGSEAPLQIVWQVKNGETKEHTVSLGSLGTYTFKRGQGAHILCNGNLPKDGKATHLISESFDRRVPMFRIPDFGESAWQQRICQIITGVPISMLHRMQKGKWDGPDDDKKWVIDDPEGFTKLLFNIRTLEEKQEVPDWQLSMIANWEGVLDASGKLSTFYKKWSELVDPASQALTSGSLPDVLMEVDNPENPTSKITPSNMIRHVEEALTIRPQVKDISRTNGFDLTRNWNIPVEFNDPLKDPIELKFGTRLAKQIMNEVYRSSEQDGKENLYAQLRIAATNAGILGEKPAVASMLNVDPTKIKGSSAQAKRMQGVLVNFLRTEYPQFDLSTNDEDILPLQQVQHAIKQMEKQQKDLQTEISPMATLMQVPNSDVDNIEQKPFKNIIVDNLDPEESLEQAKSRLPESSLLSNTAFLTALALPASGVMNIQRLWNKALTKGEAPKEEATAIAQNQSQTGLAIMSVLCRKGPEDTAQYTKLHLIHNSKVGKTLIVGAGKISSELRSQLKRNGASYVDQTDIGSESVAASNISEIMDPEQEVIVKEAFLIRNQVRPGTQGSISLAKLLTKQDQTRLVLPNFVTSIEQDDISHAKRTHAYKGSGGLFK